LNFILLFVVSYIFLFLSFFRLIKIEKIFISIYIFLVCFCVAIRGRNTPDTSGYLNFYETVTPGDFSSVLYYTYEIGFQLLTHILKMLFSGNKIIYLFSIALLNSILVVDATRKIIHRAFCENINLKFPLLFSIIIYFSYYGIFYNAITIRAALAMGLYLEALAIVLKKSISLVDLAILAFVLFISYFFHTSSVVFFCIIIVSFFNLRLSSRTYLFVWLFCSLIFFSRINVLLVESLVTGSLTVMSTLSGTIFSKFSLYEDVFSELEYKLSFKYIFQLVLGLLFLIGPIHKSRTYYKLLNIYFCGLLVGAFLAPISMIYRITDFFFIVTFLLFTLLCMSSIKKVSTVFILSFISTSFSFLLIYRVLYG